MAAFSWNGYEFETDPEANRAWYAQAAEWSCPCGHCRNFMKLVREGRLPADLREMLDRLSVPPEKVYDLCELYHENGRLYYMAQWPLAGRLVRSPDGFAKAPWGSWGFTEATDGHPGGRARGFPGGSFEFWATVWLPWTLDEPIEGRK